jgi:hypothetical protein
MQTIKQMLFTGWTLMRWLRLGLGSIIGVQAIQQHDSVSGIIAALFLLQAITNTGCCGSQGCGIPVRKTPATAEDAVYEEVK